MLFELTDKVWWGDRFAITDRPTLIKSVLNVSQNQRERYFQRLSLFPQQVPYFRLGRPDEHAVNEVYVKNLTSLCEIIIANYWFPNLVHCVAGGHRSPAAAVFFAWHIEGRKHSVLTRLRARMLDLRPDAAINRPYHRSLYQYCFDNSVNG